MNKTRFPSKALQACESGTPFGPNNTRSTEHSNWRTTVWAHKHTGHKHGTQTIYSRQHRCAETVPQRNCVRIFHTDRLVHHYPPYHFISYSQQSKPEFVQFQQFNDRVFLCIPQWQKVALFQFIVSFCFFTPKWERIITFCYNAVSTFHKNGDRRPSWPFKSLPMGIPSVLWHYRV